MVNVDGIDLSIDVADWMRQNAKFEQARENGRGWVEACCVFHRETHPSFAVNVDSGVYVCQACGATGAFVELYAHVEGLSIDDAEAALLHEYARFVPNVDEALQLDFGDEEDEPVAAIDHAATYSPYLAKRGIDARTQRLFVCGENDGLSVAIPWFDTGGRMVTVKHRSLTSSEFWYEPAISPGRLRSMLFAYSMFKMSPLLAVVEGEIDAMSCVQANIDVVALGGISVRKRDNVAVIPKQRIELLRNSAADEILVFTDNDRAGRLARAAIVDAMLGHKVVSAVDWTLADDCKDANDVLRLYGEAKIVEMVEKRVPVGLTLNIGA